MYQSTRLPACSHLRQYVLQWSDRAAPGPPTRKYSLCWPLTLHVHEQRGQALLAIDHVECAVFLLVEEYWRHVEAGQDAGNEVACHFWDPHVAPLVPAARGAKCAWQGWQHAVGINANRCEAEGACTRGWPSHCTNGQPLYQRLAWLSGFRRCAVRLACMHMCVCSPCSRRHRVNAGAMAIPAYSGARFSLPTS